MNPEEYLNYAALTPIDMYRVFIKGWFKENITLMITLISFGQGIIAVGMLLKGIMVKRSCIGGVFLCIAPLRIGAGFPFSITVSLALMILMRKDDLNYL